MHKATSCNSTKSSDTNCFPPPAGHEDVWPANAAVRRSSEPSELLLSSVGHQDKFLPDFLLSSVEKISGKGGGTIAVVPDTDADTCSPHSLDSPPACTLSGEVSETQSPGDETFFDCGFQESASFEGGNPREGASGYDESGQVAPKMREQFIKTKLCPHYSRGHCIHGAECTYAHTNEELRPLPDLQKTKLCDSVTRAYTCRIPNCTYAHTRDELRATRDLVAYKTSLCFFHKKERCLNGDKCRFAHGVEELRSKIEVDNPDFCVSHGSDGVEPRVGEILHDGQLEGLGSGSPQMWTKSRAQSYSKRSGDSRGREGSSTARNFLANNLYPDDITRHAQKAASFNSKDACVGAESVKAKLSDHHLPMYKSRILPSSHRRRLSDDEKDNTTDAGAGDLSGATTASSNFNTSPREHPESPRVDNEPDFAPNCGIGSMSPKAVKQPSPSFPNESSAKITQCAPPFHNSQAALQNRRNQGKGGSTRPGHISCEEYRRNGQYEPGARSRQWQPSVSHVGPRGLCCSVDKQPFLRHQPNCLELAQQTSIAAPRSTLANNFRPSVNVSPSSRSHKRSPITQHPRHTVIVRKDTSDNERRHCVTKSRGSRISNGPDMACCLEWSHTALSGRGHPTRFPPSVLSGQNFPLSDGAGDATPLYWAYCRPYCRLDSILGSANQPVLSRIHALSGSKELVDQMVEKESTFYED